MTLQELLDKYNKSDSVKMREELEEAIADLCDKFVHGVQTIAEKYEKSYLGEHSDYRLGRGNWSFGYVSDKSVTLKYTDNWAYGGYCAENHTFLASKVDGFSEKEYEQSLVKEVEKDLEREISIAKQQLTQAENKLKKFKESCQ